MSAQGSTNLKKTLQKYGYNRSIYFVLRLQRGRRKRAFWAKNVSAQYTHSAFPCKIAPVLNISCMLIEIQIVTSTALRRARIEATSVPWPPGPPLPPLAPPAPAAAALSASCFCSTFFSAMPEKNPIRTQLRTHDKRLTNGTSKKGTSIDQSKIDIRISIFKTIKQYPN